ncbi:MAG: RHS repeat-associated core domain-containing protein [Chloroflexi bacterium]|nr:RHS repeat-associated core domain-containing protein [Chloroflexota bacterium]
MPTDIGYTGQRLDASTGLMYYGARYYDSSLARFISADSIVPGAGNPQTLNRYSYVLGNPLKYTDPTGHYCVGGRNASEECLFIEDQIKKSYGIEPAGAYDEGTINELWKSFQSISDGVGGDNVVRNIWKGTKVYTHEDGETLVRRGICSFARSCSPNGEIYLTRWDLLNLGFSTLANELAHVWDYRTKTPQGLARTIIDKDTEHGGLWRAMANLTGGYFCTHLACREGGEPGFSGNSDWALSMNDPGRPSHARNTPWEDWAMSFQLWVTKASTNEIRRSYSNDQWSIRSDFVSRMVRQVGGAR